MHFSFVPCNGIEYIETESNSLRQQNFALYFLTSLSLINCDDLIIS